MLLSLAFSMGKLAIASLFFSFIVMLLRRAITR